MTSPAPISDEKPSKSKNINKGASAKIQAAFDPNFLTSDGATSAAKNGNIIANIVMPGALPNMKTPLKKEPKASFGYKSSDPAFTIKHGGAKYKATGRGYC